MSELFVFLFVEKEEADLHPKGSKVPKVEIDLSEEPSEAEGYFTEEKPNVGCWLHLDSLRMHPTTTIVAHLSKYLMNEKKAKDQARIKKENEEKESLKAPSSALSSSSSSASISSLQSEDEIDHSPNTANSQALVDSDDDDKEKKETKTPLSKLKANSSATKSKLLPKKDVDFVKCHVSYFPI
jgi:hypothetical protein